MTETSILHQLQMLGSLKIEQDKSANYLISVNGQRPYICGHINADTLFNAYRLALQEIIRSDMKTKLESQ